MVKEPMQPIYRAVGSRIEMLRTALGWSQLDLAKKMHQSRGSIANVETGRQRLLLHNIDQYAAAFGTTAKHLMRGIWF